MVSLQHAFIHWTLWQRDTLEIGIFLVVGCFFTHQFDLTILLLYSTWWEFMPLMAFWWNAEIRWMEKLVTARLNSYTLNETPLWIERSCLNSVAEFHLTIDHSLLYPTPASQPTNHSIQIPVKKFIFHIDFFRVYISVATATSDSFSQTVSVLWLSQFNCAFKMGHFQCTCLKLKWKIQLWTHFSLAFICTDPQKMLNSIKIYT